VQAPVSRRALAAVIFQLEEEQKTPAEAGVWYCIDRKPDR
jgi:hypothetical protein